MANRIIHFEIMAQEPERAAEFYREIFGWKVEKWGDFPYWLITTGSNDEPGINGGLTASKGESLTVNSIQVADVDATVKQIEAKGGSLAVPKRAIPGVGYVAYCKDTEGIVIGLHQPDPTAK